MDFDYTPTVTAFIILSCCIAVLVNFSTFLVIGKCDAVTYQVRAHAHRLALWVRSNPLASPQQGAACPSMPTVVPRVRSTPFWLVLTAHPPQVLGHLKTMLVLAFGFVVLQNPMSLRNLAGILIALVGMVSYAHADQHQQTAAKAAAAHDAEASDKSTKV
jgi:solute carrier family 35 protein E3